MFRRLLPLALVAVSLAVACSVSESSSPLASGERANGGDDGAGGIQPENAPKGAELGSTDAGFVGLCGVSATSTSDTCNPDDDGIKDLPDNQRCATKVDAVDGSTAPGEALDASSADYACRVARGKPTCPGPRGGGDAGPTNADKNGVDGVSCETDSDCAPGFDCVAPVGGEKTNVCRRYCCSGSCDGVAAHNGGPTFCDVRQAVRSEAAPSDKPLLAPVCMPIKTCTLLQKGECADGETCAVVNDKGATGCVPIDKDQIEKHSCEEKHCAEGYTCLGSPGDRSCYKLCKTTGSQGCPENYVCTTSSAFPDTSYGVCKPAQ